MHTARMDIPCKLGGIVSLYVSTPMKLSETLQGLGRPVVFYPSIAKVFGMQETLFLSQLVYWTGKGADPNGWIYKTALEIEDETGLSYEQQQRCRKVLGASARYGVRGARIKRHHFEQVIEERYERTSHKMYFRVNFDALDRAFSENLFSSLQSGAVGYYPHAQLGKTQERIRVLPSSSIQRVLPEMTNIDNSTRKTAHKDFVEWWNEMVLKTRKVKAVWGPADFRNLKIMLVTDDKEKLEQLALYFLADEKFKKYAPTLRVFLSKGVMEGLKNEQNIAGFWAKMDGYTARMLRSRRPVVDSGFLQDEFRNLTNNLASRFAMHK